MGKDSPPQPPPGTTNQEMELELLTVVKAIERPDPYVPADPPVPIHPFRLTGLHLGS